MDNFLNTVSEVYRNFGLENTSVSENKLPEDVRLFQRIILTTEERKRLPGNASFFMGTQIHEAVQKMICHNNTLDEVIYKDENSLIKNTRNYKPLDDKDKAKSRTIAMQSKKIIKNFVEEVNKLQDSNWKSECEYVHWDNRIGTYFRMFVDAVGDKYFIDFKNLGFLRSVELFNSLNRSTRIMSNLEWSWLKKSAASLHTIFGFN